MEIGTAEYEGERIANRGLLTRVYRSLPQPIKGLYRHLMPENARERLRGMLGYEQDLVETARFWMSPLGRQNALKELRACQTPDDFFHFAGTHFGHLQLKSEITGFLAFAAHHRPVRICEVGLYQGGTNLMLTHALPSAEFILGVDLHVRNKSKLQFLAKPSQKQVYIDGLSGDVRVLHKVAKALGNTKLDLLFLDADHSYEGAKADFLNYRHFVREGGIIVFHDIVQDHLTKFGHDPATWRGANSGEVYLLWKRLKPHYKTHEFVADYEQDGCGIGVLIYSSQTPLPQNL